MTFPGGTKEKGGEREKAKVVSTSCCFLPGKSGQLAQGGRVGLFTAFRQRSEMEGRKVNGCNGEQR